LKKKGEREMERKKDHGWEKAIKTVFPFLFLAFAITLGAGLISLGLSLGLGVGGHIYRPLIIASLVLFLINVESACYILVSGPDYPHHF